MFSSTAYDALYTYIGVHLHSASIKIITSQQFFVAVLLLTFGILFFLTAWRFVQKYMPGDLVTKSQVSSLLSFVKIIFCLFLGLTLLRVDAPVRVKTFKETSWHTNPYVTHRLPDVQDSYEVSFVFDLLSRTGEEIARFATAVVDKLFIVTNSQMEAPSYFYKAMMYAGVATIDDPELKDKVSFYTSECFDRIIPLIADKQNQDKLDALFSDATINPVLANQVIKTGSGTEITCLDLRNEVNLHLRAYAHRKTRKVPVDHVGNWGARLNIKEYYDDAYLNMFASQSLVNHYLSQHEGVMGINKGSLVPGTTARIFQYLNRLFSWDGLLSLVFQSDKHGAALTAQRSQEFSELLQRAPHIQGFVKMVLIMIFPWLVFFVIAGRWKILVLWTALYTSVLLWTPLWTLFYHIITSIALSAETLDAFGNLKNGVSLYSSQLVTSRLYHAYSVYSWVQLLIGPLPTLILAWNMRGLLTDNAGESAPHFIGDGVQLAGSVSSYGQSSPIKQQKSGGQ